MGGGLSRIGVVRGDGNLLDGAIRQWGPEAPDPSFPAMPQVIGIAVHLQPQAGQFLGSGIDEALMSLTAREPGTDILHRRLPGPDLIRTREMLIVDGTIHGCISPLIMARKSLRNKKERR